MTPIIGRATSSSAATRRPDEAAATRASQTGLPSSFSTAIGAAAEPAAAPASFPVGRGDCLRRGFSSQWFIVKCEPWHKTQVGLMLQEIIRQEVANAVTKQKTDIELLKQQVILLFT